MGDNEYLAHYIVRERLREAERRGALRAMLRQAPTAPRPSAGGADRERPRPSAREVWRRTAAAWLAHLTLPKMWNRL